MSEEEKKAIEWVKAQKGIYYKIIIEIIERQQKEIVDLNELYYDLGRNFIDLDCKCKQQQKEKEDLKAINAIQKYRIEVIDERELISKDKLREILNKYAETDVKNHVGIINFYRELKELLGEEDYARN